MTYQVRISVAENANGSDSFTELVYRGNASNARSELVKYLDNTASNDYKECVLKWFDAVDKFEPAILRNVPNGPGFYDEWSLSYR